MTALGAVLAVSIAACNSETGFSGSVGNTPNGPKIASFQFQGTIGTPFTATVSDTRSSWTLQGVTPLSLAICNNILPARIVATKTTSNSNLLSLQLVTGFKVRSLSSTVAPFGSVSVQTGGTLTTLAGPAVPDLRIFLKGPVNQHYQALVEDQTTGFVIDQNAPTLILFDTPNGKVDATFFGTPNFPTWSANMTLNGMVVATVTAGPNATIREP